MVDAKVLDDGIGGGSDVEGTPLQRLTSGASGAVILIALVLVCYISTLQFEYIWDDDAYVTQNATLRTFGGLSRIWTEVGATPQYYPMTFTSFWLERQATQGLNPRVSHGVNLLLHAGSVLILWQILKRLKVPGAWVAAALFAVHPINVESVAWITERKNTLSMILGLSAMFFYLRYAGLIEKPKPPEVPINPATSKKANADEDDDDEEEEGGEAVQMSLPDDPRRLYALFLIFFAMALLSKTAVAVLPIVLLLIAWWKNGRLGAKDVVPLIAPLVLAIGLGAITSHLEHSPDYVGATGPEWDISAPQRLMLAGQTTAFYALKLVVPHPLIFNYPRWTLNAASPIQWLPLLSVLVATAGAIAVHRRVGRGLAAGVLIYLVCLLPVMGFVNFLPMRFSWVADHFAYTASIAFLALLTAGIAQLLRRTTSERTGDAVGAVIAGVALLVCVTITVRYSFNFISSRPLWEATLKQNPKSWIGATSFGGILIEKGKTDYSYGIATADRERGAIERDKNFAGAELWLNKALSLNPYAYEAEYQLARLALERGKYDESVQHLLKAEQFAAQMQKKSFLQPQFLTANILAAQGKTDDAIAKFRELQKYEPLYASRAPAIFAQLRMGLADVLLRNVAGPIGPEMKPADAAVMQDVFEQYAIATELAPSLIPPKLKLARLLITIEQPDAALQQLRDVLAIDRNNTDAKYLGADVAMKLDQYDVAGAQLMNLLRTDPQFLPAYVKLADVLNKVGRKDEAIQQLDQALKLRPNYERAIKLKAEIQAGTTHPSTTQRSSTQPSADPMAPEGP